MLFLSQGRFWCVSVFIKAFVLVETAFSFANESKSSINVEEAKISLCQTLNNFFLLQDLQTPEGHLFGSTQAPLVAIIFQDQSSWLDVKFQEYVSSLNHKYLFLNSHITEGYEERDVKIAVDMLESYFSKIQTVVILLENSDSIVKIMKAVCTNTAFSWTHLIHTTEWIVVSENSDLLKKLNLKSFCVNYVTLIVTSEECVASAYNLENATFTKAEEDNRNCVTLKRNTKRDQYSILKKKETPGAWSLKKLRETLPDLSHLKKTSLQGLHLPVAILTDIEKPTDGNETRYEPYTLAVLNVIASTIGFTYTLVTPSDGGAFGEVKDDGTATGLVGLVARREVAFCALGMSKIDNRLKAIDFLDFQVEFVPIRIMYKLPQTEKELDMTFVDVFQNEFLMILIGPVLIIGLIGGCTHLATRSCSIAKPGLFKIKDLRKMNTCPTHLCFQRSVPYAGQTGRILRASWGVFLLILTSAYSAYLVTNLTVKPKELKIDSFEALLANPSYRIGIEGSASALITLMKTTSDPVLRETGKRIAAFNKTYPGTYSPNMTEQMTKVLEGDYAFLSYQRTEDMPQYVKGDHSEVRDYAVDPGYGLGVDYITLPKNVFYKDELNRVLLDLEETGVLIKLWAAFKFSESSVEVSAIKSEKPIPLSRLMIFVYITGGGIVAGCICLVIEIVLRKFWMK